MYLEVNVSSSINRTTYPILLIILPVHRVSFVRLGSKGSEDYWAIEYTQELADKMVAESAKSGVTYFDTAVRCALLYFPSLSHFTILTNKPFSSSVLSAVLSASLLARHRSGCAPTSSDNIFQHVTPSFLPWVPPRWISRC